MPGACSAPDCARPLGPGSARGLCPAHYQQQRRGRVLAPVRVPSAGRLTVRLPAEVLAALGEEPSVRAREILVAWVASRRP